MEVPFGYKWVVPVSNLISISFLLVTIHFKLFGDEIRIPLILFFGSLYTLPGFLRFFICYRWLRKDVRIKTSRDLSSPYYHWKGVGLRFCYEAEIEYKIDDKSFCSNLRSKKPLKKIVAIYYNPRKPHIFTQNKNYGINGIIVLIIVFVTFIYFFKSITT